MRVLQVTASTDRRGAEVFADQLAASLRRRGHQVRTVAFADPSAPAGLPFVSIGSRRFGPRELMALAKQLRAHDVCVVHGGAGLAPTAIAACITRRPFVYRNIGDPDFWGAVRLAKLRIGFPLRRAAMVVALYDAASTYMIREYGLQPDRTVVVSNAVDAARFPRRTPSTREDARARLAERFDGPLIGYLGALSGEKRPQWAVSSVARIDGAALLVAGSGPLREELDDLARHDAPDRVQFLGSTDDPTTFLTALDVLVLPSRTEGVPGALIEAALIGVPVVATDVGGVSELVRRTGCGVVVDVADQDGFDAAVRSVLADPERFVAPREAVVRDHDVERVVDRWEQTLRRAIDR